MGLRKIHMSTWSCDGSTHAILTQNTYEYMELFPNCFVKWLLINA